MEHLLRLRLALLDDLLVLGRLQPKQVLLLVVLLVPQRLHARLVSLLDRRELLILHTNPDATVG